MKQLKLVTITLLLLMTISIMKPLVAEAEEKLEKCEKTTLISIFNNSKGKIDTSYESIATELYDNICDCSYYDCIYSNSNNYDLSKINNFILFAQTLFNYINTKGSISDLKKISDKNKNITEFEELINSCYIDNLKIEDFYECSVNNKCKNTTSSGSGGTSNEQSDCTGFIGQETADLIKEILDYIRVLGPLAVIIYSALDLAKAVAGKYEGNEDALEIAKQKIGKRLFALLLLIFAPTIIKIIFNAIEGTITLSSDCILIIKNMFLWR